MRRSGSKTYDDGGAIWSKRGDLCVGPFETVLRSECGQVSRQSATGDLLTHVHHDSYMMSAGAGRHRFRLTEHLLPSERHLASMFPIDLVGLGRHAQRSFIHHYTWSE